MARRDDQPRRQPDDHDGPLDGRDHGPHRRAGARQEHHPSAPAGRRRDGVRRGPRDRHHRDHPRSLHDRGRRASRSASSRPGRRWRTARRVILLAIGIAAAGILVGRVVLDNPDFPKGIAFSFEGAVNAVVTWLRANATGITSGLQDGITFGVINPLQGVLTSAPWWLVGCRDRRYGRVHQRAPARARRRYLPRRDHRAPAVGAQHGDPDVRARGNGADACGRPRTRHRVGAQRALLRGPSAAPRRGPDDAGVRLPHPGRGAVRPNPLHGASSPP